MIPISGEFALITSTVLTVGGIATLYGKLSKAARNAAANEAAAVIRGEIGKEERDRSIRDHTSACQFPANAHSELLEAMKYAHQDRTEVAAKAHQELMEATGRIQESTNTLSGRIENITGLIVEIAKNGRNARSGA
jgi:hypothetical protein